MREDPSYMWRNILGMVYVKKKVRSYRLGTNGCQIKVKKSSET